MRISCLIVLIGLMGWPCAGNAQSRVALVIGNSSYQSVAALPNPVNDADDISASLKRLGFDVKTLSNATFDDMRRALINFGREARGIEFAVIYFAGHGMELGGENWLIPVDAQLSTDLDVANETIGLHSLTRAVSSTTKLGLIILDACRNNPFAPKMQRSTALSREVERGFARVEPNDNVLVAFAARDGTTAKDGTGRNSPFTGSLLRNIETPGLEVTFLFRTVRDDVLAATRREQQPYVYGSLSKDSVYLKPPASNAGTALPTESKPALPTPAIKPVLPVLARADVIKLFAPFAAVFERVQKSYVETLDPQNLLLSAMNSMKAMSPTTTRIAVASHRIQLSNGTSGTGFDLDSVYDVALGVLNERTSDDDSARVLNAAMTGMLASVEPRASYMDAKRFGEMQVAQSGHFGGLGVEVTMENGLIRVVTPMDGTPASRGGVMANDIITNIDDVAVKGLSLNEAVGKMRGPVGTTVRLKFLRKGVDNPIEVTLVREQVQIRAVRARIEANDLAYIRLTTFNAQTTESLKREIGNLTTQIGADKLKGFIIDLRNNPGGLFEQAITVSDVFLESGEVVSTRGRTAEANQHRAAEPGDLTKGKPLVVLINGGSAAASEIVAGALQDHKRAKVIGTLSFGNGAVQTIFPLGSSAGGGALRLTTGRYFTPLGKAIQTQGIVPDIEVTQDGPSGPSTSYVPPDPKDDRALGAAVKLLSGAK